jgi:hypothetical protein
MDSDKIEYLSVARLAAVVTALHCSLDGMMPGPIAEMVACYVRDIRGRLLLQNLMKHTSTLIHVGCGMVHDPRAMSAIGRFAIDFNANNGHFQHRFDISEAELWDFACYVQSPTINAAFANVDLGYPDLQWWIGKLRCQLRCRLEGRWPYHTEM